MLIDYLRFVTVSRLSDLYTWAEVECSDMYDHRNKLLHSLLDWVFSPAATCTHEEFCFQPLWSADEAK